MKRFIAFILIFTFLLSALSTTLSAAFSIDSPLANGLTYVETTDTMADGSLSHTYTFKYTPGKSALPVVAFGNSQKSRKTLTKLAELYGEDVVAGINADFFSFYTGIPMGCLVSEGRFLSSPVNNNALAIFEDGTLYIGKPDIKSTLTYKDLEINFYYNKFPQIYSLYVMDSTYYESTASEFDSLEIVLKAESDVLTVNSSLTCTVMAVYKNTMNTPIPEGSFVLTIPNSHASYSHFENILIGERVTLNVTGSQPWDSAVHVIGGGDVIVENSQFISETVDEYSDKVRYARSAVGLMADGSALFFAVNGKKSGYSSGMTLKELAETLISMGAVTVLNFDGGGSTTVGVKFLGEEKMQVTNFPTDGYPRGVANAVLFLNTATPDGKASSVVLLPNNYFVLKNTQIDAEEVFFDASMTLIEDAPPVSRDVSPLSQGVECFNGKIKITDSDLYERKIFATYVFENGERFEDDKTIYVPSSVDFIELSARKRVLNLDESTKIDVRTEYYGFEAASSLFSFNWSFSENNLEALEEGVLAQNDVARLLSDGTLEILTDTLFTSATLIAEYGGVKDEMTVYVGLEDKLLDDFEALNEGFSEGYRSEKALSFENDFEYENALKTELIPTLITLMYKGKFTGKASVVIITANGEEIELPYTVDTDYSSVTGWTKLKAYVPLGLEDAIFIKTPFYAKRAENVTVDNLSASYGYEKPLFDDIDDSWAKDYIKSAYDMGIVSGYEENGKVLFSPNRNITRAEFAKLVTVFKNLTFDSTSENLPVFSDSDKIPEWSRDYINAVALNNIMNGRREDDSSVFFAPNDPITRTEAMLVLSRLMPNGGIIFPLTFKDNKDVPSWAAEGVKKTVSAGIITGYDDNTIRPNNNITRAETAVVFSRLYTYVYEKFVSSDEFENNTSTNNPLA